MRHLRAGVGLKCRLLLMGRLFVFYFNFLLVCGGVYRKGSGTGGGGGKTDCLDGRLGIRISFLVGARDTPLEILSELGKIRLHDLSH